MALVLKDRVRETTTTTGTGSLTLAGAVTGFQTFSSAIGNTNTTFYSIGSPNSSEWEVGLGTVSAGALSRDVVIGSSNAGSLVNLSSGSKDVFCTYPATKAVYLDGNGNAGALGTIASANLANCTFPTLNQNTTGSAGSVANAHTAGTGLSGSTFNGSAAITWTLATAYGDSINPYASKTANYVLAAPNGTAGVPTFRAIVAADIPTLNQNTTGSSGSCTGNAATATTATTANALNTANNYQVNSLGVGTAGSGTAGEIRATNNVTAYYSSDSRLKENIQEIDNALSIVCAIGSKTFDWTDAYIAEHGGEDGYFVKKSDFGVVAQDVQLVFPQAVRTRQDGTLAVDYEKLATLSFGAIHQLLKRIEILESK